MYGFIMAPYKSPPFWEWLAIYFHELRCKWHGWCNYQLIANYCLYVMLIQFVSVVVQLFQIIANSLLLNPINTLYSGYLLRIFFWVLLMVHKCWDGTHSTFIGPNKICWLSCGIILRTSHVRKASATMLPLVLSLDKSYTSEAKYGSEPGQSFRKFHTRGVQPDCSQGIT